MLWQWNRLWGITLTFFGLCDAFQQGSFWNLNVSLSTEKRFKVAYVAPALKRTISSLDYVSSVYLSEAAVAAFNFSAIIASCLTIKSLVSGLESFLLNRLTYWDTRSHRSLHLTTCSWRYCATRWKLDRHRVFCFHKAVWSRYCFTQTRF